MKRINAYIISSILIIIMIIFVWWYNVPRIDYKYNQEFNYYEVNKVYGKSDKYNIKDEINGIKVKKINTRAFYNNQYLREVNLPLSVDYISRLAFSECKNLERINLDNIEVIERNAFSYCYKLNNISLKAKNIGGSAFYKCLNLDELYLNDGIITIGSMAFSNTKVRKVKIPRTVEKLENDVFYECFALESINVYGPNLLDNEYLKKLKIVNYIG